MNLTVRSTSSSWAVLSPFILIFIFWPSILAYIPRKARHWRAPGSQTKHPVCLQQAPNIPWHPYPISRHISTDHNEVETLETQRATPELYMSHIALIRSSNLAGAGNHGSQKEVSISLGDAPNLVAVTGETGSGKSLLIAKVAELVTGGKATSSSVPGTTSDNGSVVEMVLRLSEPHLSMVQRSLQIIGLDPDILFQNNGDTMGSLSLRRELSIGGAEEKLKSVCSINGHAVTRRALRFVASPLLAIVDASVAAAALTKASSRMAIIDTAVPAPVLSYARLTRNEYRKCRIYRQRLEKELSNRMLPVSMVGVEDDDKDLEMLQHWVDELDAFEERVTRFCESVGEQVVSRSNLSTAAAALSSSSWFDDASEVDDGANAFSSALYTNIVDFRDAVKSLDSQLHAAHCARDALSSLSSPDSAITAIERTRNHLFDATGNEDSESPLCQSAEKTHDLLNKVDEALAACARSLEDDRSGLLNVLENMRGSIGMSIEDIDVLLSDWNTLARKHGMSPFVLPACHRALRSELDGNVEARLMLPEAISDEEDALEKFEAACSMLSKARQNVSRQLAHSVTQRMPSLGMERSTFAIDMQAGARQCTDAAAYGPNAILGTDLIDFLLIHGKTFADSDESLSTGTNSRERGGKLDVVASAGEKARILLAIECELPGSIGAANRAHLASENGPEESSERTEEQPLPPPVSVIYDEIDAHVGGRAAVAMAKMLADQSRPRTNSDVKGQVVSITHSPSVAAIADLHILIQRQNPINGQDTHVPVRAAAIDDTERRKELARMASGDLAPDEAEVFADALLRDGARRRATP